MNWLRLLYYDTKSLRQHVDGFNMQGGDFAVERDVDGAFEVEIDSLDAFAFGHGMVNVLPGEETGKIANQAEPADWPPANVLDQPIGSLGVGSDHHFAAGEFAVVECKEKAAAAIHFRTAINA
jgi:hypothetical protein